MKQKTILLLACLICAITSYAQIGYQVSLLNSATGEPRANETVSVSVAITNSEDAEIFSSTQSATTNDFGVLSLQIGNSTTFTNVDWSKLPFFISATVDGVMIGKSQILSVPVAEVAKNMADVSLDKLCAKEWNVYYRGEVTGYYKFNPDYTYLRCAANGEKAPYPGTFSIHGNVIILDENPEPRYARIFLYANDVIISLSDYDFNIIR